MSKRVKLRYFNDSFPCEKGYFSDAAFVKVLVVDDGVQWSTMIVEVGGTCVCWDCHHYHSTLVLHCTQSLSTVIILALHCKLSCYSTV